VLAQIMRNGSAYHIAQLQFLVAKGHLATLPSFSKAQPPKLEQLEVHVLPALAAALDGFTKLRCHREVAQLLYHRARVYHTLGDVAKRGQDAALFARAEALSAQAAARPCGQLLEFAAPGALEAHLEQLSALDAEAAAIYAS